MLRIVQGMSTFGAWSVDQLRHLHKGLLWVSLLALCVACGRTTNTSMQPTDGIPTRPSAASPTDRPPTPTQLPTLTQAPQPTTVVGDPEAAPVLPPGLPEAQISRVIDGDTVEVRLNGQVERVRLIGIDTPETVDPREPVQCFGREASARAHELLDGQTVALESDPSQDDRDRYGRLLRFVWLVDGRLVNLELVAQGYAFEYTYNLPYRYQAAFQAAERAAREQQLGLWSPQTCNGEARPADPAPPSVVAPSATAIPAPTLPPAPSATPVPPPVATKPPAANCDPAYPDVCIPPPPPDLDCGEVPYRRFRVLPPDPHRFDRDRDGIGCE